MFFMAKKLKMKIIKRFNNIKFSKIILFRNPNEFTNLYIEKINPNHKGLIWGRRHKKFNKGTNYIMVGKVFFSWLPVIIGTSIVGWLDMFTNYIYNLLLSIGIFTFFICSIFSVSFYLVQLRISEVKPKNV